MYATTLIRLLRWVERNDYQLALHSTPTDF